MLRVRLGDEAFFGGVAKYLDKHQFGQVETDDFRVILEETSGQSLERFFDQWCKRPGHPSLEVDLSWAPGESGDAGTLNVAVDQTQKIDADNPAYAIVVPLWIKRSETESDGEWRQVVMDTKHAAVSIGLSKRPRDVEVDPQLTLLCRRKVRQPLDQALNRLHDRGVALAARIDAIEQLAASPDPRACIALARLAMPTSIWPESAYVDDPSAVIRHAASDALAAQINIGTASAKEFAIKIASEYRTVAGVWGVSR